MKRYYILHEKGGKMAKKQGSTIGRWAFLLGVILAVVLGAFGQLNETWVFVLVVIGLIVGFLNIVEEEVSAFLMSGAVLIIASALGQSVMSVSNLLSNVLQALLAIFVPATIIVAIKNAWGLARH